MNFTETKHTKRVSHTANLFRRWRWWLWLILFVAWTVGLVIEIPPHATSDYRFGHISLTHKFIIAKTMHVVVYAILAALVGWQICSLRFRRFLLFVLILHGPATELIQRYVSNRTGRFIDVGLDYVGILIGVLLTRKYWFNSEAGSEMDDQADD